MNSHLLDLKIQTIIDETNLLNQELEVLVRERASTCPHHQRVVGVSQHVRMALCTKCGASGFRDTWNDPKINFDRACRMRDALTGNINIHGEYLK